MFEPAFPCTHCGACCRNVGRSELTAWLGNEEGVCRYLDESTNLCTIYETRPDICKIDLQYREHFIHQYSWSEFVELNVSACTQLQKITDG